MPYKLASTLSLHNSDVRAVASPTNDLVLSASRDTTAVAWNRTSDGFTPAHVLKAGSRYVNAVTYIPPREEAPKGYAVTGGQDMVINIFNLENPKADPDITLVGHTENVCALDASASGTIISGSWDKTAKVWKNFELVHELKGHEYSVWAVLIIDEDQYLTGSADKSIKLWQGHKVINTFKGHTDAVRGLAIVPDLGFASCSNDSEVRVWTLGGDSIYSLSGHTSFVYSLSVLPNGNIVSSGEDRTVRVWEGDECTQTIVHPAISVWAVSSMPNGDIVTGCSDGVVRVFSAVEERWASAEDLKTFDDQVATQALPSQQVGDVKKSDLPSTEALSVPGKKAGEVKMIKNGDVVEAYQWDSAAGSWQKIGDVVDAVGQGRKQLYQGKEYDYVFDVDIQDGVPPLKLPYNVSENPYMAAQRFLQNNDLEMSYLDQVVKFIEQNTAGIQLGTGGEEYQDPFTGASRYRSGAAASQGAAPSEYMDPFTGASRYRAQPTAPAPAPVSTGYSDPFTGASRYTPGAPSPAPPQPVSPPSQKVLPVSKAVTFKQANIPAMQGKILQFNDALKREISTSSLAAYPEESTALNEIFADLEALIAVPPRRKSSSLGPPHIQSVISILERWPVAQRFPVVDLARLLFAFCGPAFKTPGLRESFIEALFKASDWNTPWTSPIPKTRETNILLLFRSLANVFGEGVDLPSSWVVKLFESLGEAPYPLFNKNQRVALATVLFNISVLGVSSPLDLGIRDQLLLSLLGLLSSETTDSEAAYRGLVAVGNTAYATKLSNKSLDADVAAQLKPLLRSVASTFPEDRIRGISAEIFVLLV